MAAIAILPIAKVRPVQQQQQSKPSRSMTHPIHDPKLKPPRRRTTKKGEPFDPEDLSRRLTAHLLEQKAKQERRRAAVRASQDAAALELSGGIYHHVPTVAASAFERTTTPDVMRQVHKLAQPVVRQLDGEDVYPRTGEAAAGFSLSTLLQKRQAMDQAALDREKVRNRNQWQWGSKMEEAAEVDADRAVFRKPTRTFSELAQLATTWGKGERPLSTGDVFCEEQENNDMSLLSPKSRTKFVFDGRGDWTQMDEERDEKRTIMERAGLRKRESLWQIRGKKDKDKDKTEIGKGVKDRDEAVAGIGNLDSPPLPENKSRKNSFLARFAIKRQPS